MPRATALAACSIERDRSVELMPSATPSRERSGVRQGVRLPSSAKAAYFVGFG